MSKTATKVAISMPHELYRALEQVRKKNGMSRSAILQEALRLWLKRQQEAEWSRQYIEGYRKKPETRREIEAAMAMAIPALSTEEW